MLLHAIVRLRMRIKQTTHGKCIQKYSFEWISAYIWILNSYIVRQYEKWKHFTNAVFGCTAINNILLRTFHVYNVIFYINLNKTMCFFRLFFEAKWAWTTFKKIRKITKFNFKVFHIAKINPSSSDFAQIFPKFNDFWEISTGIFNLKTHKKILRPNFFRKIAPHSKNGVLIIYQRIGMDSVSCIFSWETQISLKIVIINEKYSFLYLSSLKIDKLYWERE